MTTTPKPVVVRYAVNEGAGDANARNISAVFDALAHTAHAGLAYMVVRLPDDTFIHIAQREPGATPLADVPAFQEFQRNGAALRAESPKVVDATIVGVHGVFSREPTQ